jgi:hypothetical protein
VLDCARLLPACAAPSRRAFDREWVARARPGLFDGLVAHWRALREWTPEALAERYRDVKVDAYRVRDGALVFDPRTGLTCEEVRFGELVTEMAAGGLTRRMRHRDLGRLPGLDSEAPVPSLCAGRIRLEPNLWISAAGTRSQLHFDQPHTLLVQVYGTKRVLLLEPSERRNVYPHAPWSPIAQFSRVDVARPDLARFPLLSRARGLRCDLAPGQALFIPGGFWHYLDSNEATISLGYRWWSPRHLPRLVAADVYKRLRGHAR